MHCRSVIYRSSLRIETYVYYIIYTHSYTNGRISVTILTRMDERILVATFYDTHNSLYFFIKKDVEDKYRIIAPRNMYECHVYTYVCM